MHLEILPQFGVGSIMARSRPDRIWCLKERDPCTHTHIYTHIGIYLFILFIYFYLFIYLYLYFYFYLFIQFFPRYTCKKNICVLSHVFTQMCSERFLFKFECRGGGGVFAQGCFAVRNRLQPSASIRNRSHLRPYGLWPYYWRLLEKVSLLDA